jgi:hypothetical protein
MIIVSDIDPCILDSIFPTPGRNDPCSCGSGIKYKRCCLSSDEESWRVVAELGRKTDAVLAIVRALPRSIYPDYDPGP